MSTHEQSETVQLLYKLNIRSLEELVGIYLERNHPDIAPNFYIDCKFFDSSREMMGKSFTEQFRSGDIQNIKIFAARTPLLAYFPLQKAMFSLPPIKATH
jgi:hypothetical protein